MSDLKHLSDLAAQLQEARMEASRREAEYKKAAIRVQDLQENLIPEAMAAAGVDSFTTVDGKEITVVDFIGTTITEATREAAHKWLEDNGHGGMIKREISVLFNREQEEEANSLVGKLKDDYPAVQHKKSVHSSTLKSWVTGQLQDGADFPQELFNVFVKKVAKVK